MEKIKVSPFEYAIRTAANPDDSRFYEPYTPKEIEEMRRKNMEEQMKRFKVKLTNRP